MRFGLARAVAAVSTWGLKHVFRRPAANFPGKVALYVDPALVRDLAPRVDASICVVGTNGKTTVTNLLADAFEAAGARVVCNRTGANLDSGVTTALLQAGKVRTPNQVDRSIADGSQNGTMNLVERSIADGSQAAEISSMERSTRFGVPRFGVPPVWGVFECDELWLAKVTPGLQPRFVLLLNLFRDQLDRIGEIDHIQESIAGALAASPGTTLIYNADDPLCQAIADRVENPRVPFGLEGDLGLPANTVADARMCQRCSTMLEYDWRHYGQLGAFRCPNCGFARVRPAYVGRVVEKGKLALTKPDQTLTGFLSSQVSAPSAQEQAQEQTDQTLTGLLSSQVSAPSAQEQEQAQAQARQSLDYGASSYMAYNLLAIWAACDQAGVPFEALARAAEAFDPHNGRLERYTIGGRDVLLNLAKNPTGFNQNLNIVLDGAAGTGNAAVAFYINDKEADGHDVSWLWDIDFQNLASAVEAGDLRVFAGGIRRNDMQVRLKYAGVPAELVDGADDFLARVPEGGSAYVIANYTALPAVKAALDQLQGGTLNQVNRSTDSLPASAKPSAVERSTRFNVPRGTANLVERSIAEDSGRDARNQLPMERSTRFDVPQPAPPLTIAHLFPTLLNLYGDNGNVTVLAQRARWRGIDVRVVEVDEHNMRDLDWSAIDLVFLGGGPDREQRLAAQFLAEMADDLRAFVENDGVVLAICGGFQIIGREWLMGEEIVPGLGILGVSTQRAEGGSHNRLVGNIALRSPLAPELPVVGYENHAGRTFLDPGVEPFGRVAGSHGSGNNDRDHADGALFRNVVGTYLHGPLLAKNPEVADELLRRALEKRAPGALIELDDAEERAANAYMAKRLE